MAGRCQAPRDAFHTVRAGGRSMARCRIVVNRCKYMTYSGRRRCVPRAETPRGGTHLGQVPFASTAPDCHNGSLRSEARRETKQPRIQHRRNTDRVRVVPRYVSGPLMYYHLSTLMSDAMEDTREMISTRRPEERMLTAPSSAHRAPGSTLPAFRPEEGQKARKSVAKCCNLWHSDSRARGEGAGKRAATIRWAREITDGRTVYNMCDLMLR